MDTNADPVPGLDLDAPPFDLLDDASRQRVRSSIDLGYYPADTVMIEAGHASEHFFIVLKGRVLAFERHGEDCAALITDVVMPKMDGTTLARRLLDRAPNIKVILMSGYDTNDEAATLADAPGRRFLRKPVVPDALLAMLRLLLDEDETAHEEEFLP